jgi:hypothetical protein
MIDHAPLPFGAVIFALEALQEEHLCLAILVDAEDRTGDIVAVEMVDQRLGLLAGAAGIVALGKGVGDGCTRQAESQDCAAQDKSLHDRDPLWTPRPCAAAAFECAVQGSIGMIIS